MASPLAFVIPEPPAPIVAELPELRPTLALPLVVVAVMLPLDPAVMVHAVTCALSPAEFVIPDPPASIVAVPILPTLTSLLVAVAVMLPLDPAVTLHAVTCMVSPLVFT